MIIIIIIKNDNKENVNNDNFEVIIADSTTKSKVEEKDLLD